MKCFYSAVLWLLLLNISVLAQNEKVSGSIPFIDARDWEFRERLMPLSGDCVFFENQLVEPSQCKTMNGTTRKFPGLFDGSAKDPGGGYATYYINVVIPSGENKLALSIPQIYSSYKIWVNENLLVESGKVGKTKEESKPQWVAKTAEFENHRDTLSIVLQVANFHHAKAGVKENIYLGRADNVLNKKRISVVANLSETVILFLIGFLFLVVFLFSERKKVAFYFSMLCITWAVRSIFSNQYLFTSYFPETNWAWQVRIEYITLFLTIIWGALTISNLYKTESNEIVKYALVVSNFIFVVFSLAVEPRIFTQWLNLYLVVGVMLLIYAATVIIRAWVKDRIGSTVLSVSIFVAALIFGYDIIVFEIFTTYNPLIFSLGYISIFSLIGLALAMHINLIRSSSNTTTRLTYDDLYKKE